MNNLGVAATNRQIIKLAAPISLAILIPQLSFFTNTIFVGQLGERELGVNGITGVFYLILCMIGYGLASGIQVQMARRAGAGDKQGLAQLLSNGVMLSVLFSLGLMMITLWLVPLLFGFSLQDDNNFALSINFIYLRVWGLPFLILTQLLSSFFISISRSRMLIYGSIAATIVNVLLDYGLIFGKLGLPAMGFNGAALASVLAEITGCLVMVGLFFYHRLHVDYPLFPVSAFRYWSFAAVFVCGCTADCAVYVQYRWVAGFFLFYRASGWAIACSIAGIAQYIWYSECGYMGAGYYLQYHGE
jgi:multidrug resistance protein, MATE family